MKNQNRRLSRATSKTKVTTRVPNRFFCFSGGLGRRIFFFFYLISFFYKRILFVLMWFLLLISAFGLTPKRRLHPSNLRSCSHHILRPVYVWLLQYRSILVQSERRIEYLNWRDGFASYVGEWCSPTINRHLIMVTHVGLLLVHLLHSLILPLGIATGGCFLFQENRRSISLTAGGGVRSLSISSVVLVWMILTRDELVISVKNLLSFHDVQGTQSRLMKGFVCIFIRYLWYIDWRIWDPGMTYLRRLDESIKEKICLYWFQSKRILMPWIVTTKHVWDGLRCNR